MADNPAPSIDALQRPDTKGRRPPDQLSASDEDRLFDAQANDTRERLESEAAASGPFGVFTPKGPRPFFPEGPEPVQSPELTEDNPFNPRGGPSQSLPQQATPLISKQDVLAPDEMADLATYMDIASTQDGLAPDDPRNPRGTPDYITEGPSPMSNPADQQHDGRTSHEDRSENPEAKRYWEDTDNA